MDYDSAALETISKRFRRDMWELAPDDAVVESGVKVKSFGPVQATAFAELFEVPRVNIIEGAAEPGAVTGGHLARAVEWMRAHEVEYRVHVASGRPGTGTAEKWLRGNGFERHNDWAKFVRDASMPRLTQPPEIEIIELLPEEGEGMDSIASEALGLPFIAALLFYDLPRLSSWRCYVALLEGELVACGSMLIAGDVAEFGVDATMEHARGRGCNLSLLRRRILDARRAGCQTFFADLGECEPGASDAIRRNLQRVGFDEAYVSQCWQRPGFEKQIEDSTGYWL
jgi:hypothetical protein